MSAHYAVIWLRELVTAATGIQDPGEIDRVLAVMRSISTVGMMERSRSQLIRDAELASKIVAARYEPTSC